MKSLSFAMGLGCLLALTFCLGLTTANGDPGSLVASISVPSVSNIVGLLATILPSYVINGKTFAFEFQDSGLLYNIKVNSIHINTLTVNERWVDFVGGTSKIRLHLGGIDVDSQLDGVMTIVGLIPIYAAGLKIKGLVIEVDLEAIAQPDGIKWQL